MVYAKDLLIPPTGEPVDSARLVAWAVKPGDAFREGDILFEMETDKSVIEIPAPQDGVMLDYLVQVDGLLSSDTAVARIEVEGDAPQEVELTVAKPEESPAAKAIQLPTGATAIHDTKAVATFSTSTGSSVPERHFATPSARRVAKEQGVSIIDVKGTGPQGRVTQSDVVRHGGSGVHTLGNTAVSGFASTGVGRSDGLITTPRGDIYFKYWTPAAPRNVPTVVLIHGVFGDIDTWAGTISALTRAGVPVVGVDLPCHGKTSSNATAFQDIVDAVAAAIATRICGAVSLVGHSFGAAIAARLSQSPSLNVNALTLISPVGLGTEINQSFLDGMLFAGNAESLTRELGKLTNASMPLSADYLSEIGGRLQDRFEQIKQLCQGLSRSGVQQVNILPDLDKASCQVTLIHGRQDAIIPWQHALNAPAKVALHLVPGAGHMPQWEASSLVNDLIVATTIP